jgi:nucleoside-diphosphate-sugar epimerase
VTTTKPIARAVVTGAQGLLGRHVTATLLDSGAEAVLGLGRSPRSRHHYTHTVTWQGSQVPAPLPHALRRGEGDPRYAYRPLDLADGPALAAALGSFGAEVVLHCAAALRDSSWTSLAASNVDATVTLVSAAARAGVRRVVLASSGSVYGAGRGELPLREDGPLEPVDLYGASKRCGEEVGRILAERHGVSLVSARVFNLVGPGLQERHLPAVLAGRLVEAGRRPGPHVLSLGWLGATRDFIDVRDAAEALTVLAAAPAVGSAVNVASGQETPVRRVLELLLDLSGRPEVLVEEGVGRAADVARAVADVDRLRAHGFVAQRSLEESLGDMVTYYGGLGGR